MTYPQPFMSHSEWIMSILTSIYVVLTGIYVIYSSRTFRAIKNQNELLKSQSEATQAQLEIASKSADAAALTAQTMINAQRPFVMIEVVNEEHNPEFWAVNYGKSPAQIIFSNRIPRFICPRMDEYPKELNYGTGYDDGFEQFNVEWIPPGSRYSLGYFDRSIVRELSPEWLDELNDSTRVCLVYSALKYRGLDRKTIYTSKYCYRVLGSVLRMEGDYGWNSCT